MKEDILEQLVDDYLQAKGYFTQHNLKFKPRVGCVGYDAPQDRVASDIDVIGIHPKLEPPHNVWVVGCKSWQDGFAVRQMLDAIDHNKKIGGKVGWKHFRELSKDKWAAAFMDAVEAATNTRYFTYVTAVTILCGDDSVKSAWTSREDFVHFGSKATQLFFSPSRRCLKRYSQGLGQRWPLAILVDLCS